jgi:hypothetical protein
MPPMMTHNPENPIIKIERVTVQHTNSIAEGPPEIQGWVYEEHLANHTKHRN